MNRDALNSLLTEKSQASRNDNYKTIVVRLPRKLYAQVQKQQGRILDEAADNGITSKVSITTVVMRALETFCGE
jgi:hypothetical protein